MKTYCHALASAGALFIAGASLTEAGSDPGPKAWTVRIEGGAQLEYKIRFRGGETAFFIVRGEKGKDADVDGWVFDEAGKELVADLRFTDEVDLKWTPPKTGVFTIRLKNLDKSANNCFMSHN